jgi:hypothetical protein
MAAQLESPEILYVYVPRDLNRSGAFASQEAALRVAIPFLSILNGKRAQSP